MEARRSVVNSFIFPLNDLTETIVILFKVYVKITYNPDEDQRFRKTNFVV